MLGCDIAEAGLWESSRCGEPRLPACLTVCLSACLTAAAAAGGSALALHRERAPVM